MLVVLNWLLTCMVTMFMLCFDLLGFVGFGLACLRIGYCMSMIEVFAVYLLNCLFVVIVVGYHVCLFTLVLIYGF